MAHYALLDDQNKVVQVIVGRDEEELGIDWEEYYSRTTGMLCKRTSYNTYGNQHIRGGIPFRKNFAAVEFIYNEELDAFVPPKPFESWILDEETCLWQSPVSIPEDDKIYNWDESSLSWIETSE